MEGLVKGLGIQIFDTLTMESDKRWYPLLFIEFKLLCMWIIGFYFSKNATDYAGSSLITNLPR
jgi:hypothetical protein